MSSLKPCPFCGGDADHPEETDIGGDAPWFVITCRQCATSSGASQTAELARSRWNKRVNANIVSALEPFAEHASEYTDEPDHMQVWPTFTVGDFRRALATLTHTLAGERR